MFDFISLRNANPARESRSREKKTQNGRIFDHIPIVMQAG
jgi:hypothetical protein